uniref:Uncharacterized protein n=1 Tax=Mustela putorius furo TaxID=9669 RepID=M3YL27_MUSPF
MSCPLSEWTHDSLPSRALPITLPTSHRRTFPASPPWPAWPPSSKWMQYPIPCKTPGWLSGLKPLPSAQFMIPGSWDQAPHRPLCSAGSLLPPLSLCLPF